MCQIVHSEYVEVIVYPLYLNMAITKINVKLMLNFLGRETGEIIFLCCVV